MDTSRDIFPINFEPVRKLLITAYKSGDFTAADAIIVRKDAYCWSSGRAVAYMLSRTSHPGYTLQLTDFFQGRAIGDIDIKHARELALPDGACAVGVVHADLGIENELAERFGIYITRDAFEQFGHIGERADSRDSIQPDTRSADLEISICER